MSVQNIYLQRHGEASHNVGLGHGPNATVPLTERGRTVLRDLPQKIEEADFIQTPDIILCSPFERTVRTAEGGVRIVYPQVNVQLHAGLIEWANFDCAPGEIMTPEFKKPIIQAIWEKCDPDFVANEYGETFRASVERGRQVTEELFAMHADNIFCVTHGHFIRSFCYDLMDEMTIDRRGMELCQDTVPVDNLDIVHIARDRETGTIAIERYLFDENYTLAHTYPVRKQTKPAEEAKLF